MQAVLNRIWGTDEYSEEQENGYDEFLELLSEHVAEDDAVLIFESGHEKMRYVTGNATVITKSGIEYINMIDLAIEKAQLSLGNSEWTTQTDY